MRNSGPEGSQSRLMAQASLLSFHSWTLFDFSFASLFYTHWVVSFIFLSLSLSLSLSDTHTQTHGPRTKKEESKTRLIFLEILLEGSVILPVQEMCKMITVHKDRLCVLDVTFISAFFFTESQRLVSFSAFHVLKASSQQAELYILLHC